MFSFHVNILTDWLALMPVTFSGLPGGAAGASVAAKNSLQDTQRQPQTKKHNHKATMAAVMRQTDKQRFLK